MPAPSWACVIGQSCSRRAELSAWEPPRKWSSTTWKVFMKRLPELPKRSRRKNTAPPPREEEYWDPREPLINASNLRNDIQVFHLLTMTMVLAPAVPGFLGKKSGSSWSCLVMADRWRKMLFWKYVRWLTRKSSGPSSVFNSRTVWGSHICRQQFFGPTNWTPVRLMPGRRLLQNFHSATRYWLSGDYSIDAAIAEGTQDSHVQHHWLRNALIVKAHASPICLGSVGIPMKKITLEIHDKHFLLSLRQKSGESDAPVCHTNYQQFFETYLPHIKADPVRIVEIGSLNVNGSLRDVCPSGVDYISISAPETG